jgi:ADP-ribose pyrophosphatase
MREIEMEHSKRVNSSDLIYQGRIFSLVKENITLQNGVTTNLDIIRHPGASAVVPILKNHRVILIRQYRHALNSFIWEIPAGTLDENEMPLQCAKRELREETGFSADDWKKLGEITPVPAYSDERIHIFMATDLAPAEQKLDRDEIINIHPVKLVDAVEMIYRGEIQDSKTISALLMARRWLKGT